MGKLLPGFRKSLVDEIQIGILANTSHYYAFASNPVPFTGSLPTTNGDDYDAVFGNDWKMVFGKKLNANNIFAMIKRYDWTSNTVYSYYDDKQDLSNSVFYVITTPTSSVGYYNIYKCIDNANGVPSTSQPDLVQPQSFQKSDGYIWRYISSIDYVTYARYTTTQFVPVTSNATIVASAANYTGIEKIVVTNAGSGYETWHNGAINGVLDSYTIQIANNAASVDNYYTNNSIYIYDVNGGTAQLRNIVAYKTTIGQGNFVTVDAAVNTTLITAGSTQYKISPQVYFETDASSKPKAYSTVTPGNNTIGAITIVDTGSGLTWANAKIISNSSYGTGASLRPIAPPAGGHGHAPSAELQGAGIGYSFTFSNTELNSISTDLTYNQIGIIRNPTSLLQDGSGDSNGVFWLANTFNQVLKASINPTGVLYTVGDTVKGRTSNATGIVVFSNSSILHLVGDKYFSNLEMVTSSDGIRSTAITINTYGDIYASDVYPLYVQNIDNVTRSNTQSETFKLIIQV